METRQKDGGQARRNTKKTKKKDWINRIKKVEPSQQD